jgi:hypothetical protein
MRSDIDKGFIVGKNFVYNLKTKQKIGTVLSKVLTVHPGTLAAQMNFIVDMFKEPIDNENDQELIDILDQSRSIQV